MKWVTTALNWAYPSRNVCVTLYPTSGRQAGCKRQCPVEKGRQEGGTHQVTRTLLSQMSCVSYEFLKGVNVFLTLFMSKEFYAKRK